MPIRSSSWTGGVVQGKVLEQTADKVTVEDIDGVRSSYGMGSVENVVKELRVLADYAIKEVPAYAKQNNMQAQEPFFWQIAGDKGLGASIVEVK